MLQPRAPIFSPFLSFFLSVYAFLLRYFPFLHLILILFSPSEHFLSPFFRLQLLLLCVPSRPTLDRTERFFILLLFFLFLLMKTTRKGRETLDMCTYIFGSNYMFMFMDVRCFTIAFCTPNLSGKNIVLSIAAAAAVAWRCLPGDCDAAAARVEMLIVATPNCLELES